MLNPDGVIIGNTRCNLAGRDLNRQYKNVIKVRNVLKLQVYGLFDRVSFGRNYFFLKITLTKDKDNNESKQEGGPTLLYFIRI